MKQEKQQAKSKRANGKAKKISMSESLRQQARKHKGTDMGEMLGFLAFFQDAVDRAGREQLGRWWELLKEQKPWYEAVGKFRSEIRAE